jgi:hypothetical protein
MRLESFLDSAVRARVPILIWGSPGVGKSAAVQAWAGRRGLNCWTVIASLREPADFGGLPIVRSSEAGHASAAPSVQFAPPRFAVEAAEQGGVIFLDELTTAPPAVQAALLRAVTDCAFGDLQLDPDRVTLLAAANPPSEAAGGWDLAPPLANRFSHHRYELVPQEWTEAFPHYWGAPPVLSFGGRQVDPAAWAQVRAVLAGFLHARPSLLLQLPADAAARSEAWPSPRTWDYLSRLWASTQEAGVSLTDAFPLLAGCVGEGAALELSAWVRDLDLPDPEHLLARPSRYRTPRRRDQAYAILSAVTQAALATLTEARWLAAWRVLSRAAKLSGADVAASAARRLARAYRSDLPLPDRELEAFLPMLEAASLLPGQPADDAGER